MNALKKDLRSAHFNLGNDRVEYQSSAKSTLIDHEVKPMSMAEAKMLSSNVSKVNFKIGDEKKRDLKDAQSTYK